MWADRHSPFNPANDRANTESELLALSPSTPTTVLHLCGLWGGDRLARHWVGKIAPTKEALRNKVGLVSPSHREPRTELTRHSDQGGIHMIHGLDVSRAILAVHRKFEPATGQRWLVTDQRIYDWWDLASAWGETKSREKHPDQDTADDGRGPQPRWVKELMAEQGVRILPRNIEALGRALDSREFWSTFGLEPVKARLEE